MESTTYRDRRRWPWLRLVMARVVCALRGDSLRRGTRSAALAIVGITASLVMTSPASALYTTVTPSTWQTGCRAEDDVWVISTRCLSMPCEGGAFAPDVRHVGTDGQWRSDHLAELQRAQPQPTLVYVHGNRMTDDDALRSGWDLYYALIHTSNMPAMRLIIWSWPSDQIPGQLRDVRAKAERADEETFYLAEFLSSMPPETPCTLVGYSFGCRVISGAMHLLAGGSLCNRSLARPYSAPLRVRMALLAPAMETHVFGAGGIYQAALDRVDRALVVYNSCDPVLKRYRWLDRCPSSRAMGYHGVVGDVPGTDLVWERDVAGIVGRSHSLARYFGAAEIVGTIQRYALWYE